MYLLMRTAQRALVGSLLLFLVLTCARAGTPALTFGNVTFRPPDGWKETRGANFLTFLPPGSADNPQIVLGVYAPAPLNGRSPEDWLETFTRTAHKGYAEKRHTEAQNVEGRDGLRTFGRSYVLEQKGETQVRTYYVACIGSQAQLFLIVTKDAKAFEKYSKALTDSLNSIQPSTDAQPEVKTTAPEPAALSVKSSADPILRGLWLNAGPKTKSRDGSHLAGVFIKDAALDLTDHTLYAAAISVGDFAPHGGIFASGDNGQTWKELYSQDCEQIVPTGTGRLYALESRGAQIVASDDHGRTWTRLPKIRFSLSGSVLDADILCIAASPANPDVLYAGARGVHGAGLYKSVNGGRSWTQPTRAASIPYDNGTLEVKDTDCAQTAVDPGDANIVFATFNGTPCQSSDGGVHFYGCTGIGKGAGPASRSALTPKVIRPGRVQIDPTMPNLGYLRCTEHYQDRLYRTGDGGRTWARLQIPGVNAINTIALHPGAPQIVYAATDRGLYVSSDAGRNWRPLQSADAPRSSGGFTIPSYFNGTAFNSVATVVSADEPILVDPETGHLLYGTALGLRTLVPVK